MNILYFAFGYPGSIIYKQIKEIAKNKKNIFVITHLSKDNKLLTEKLGKDNVTFSKLNNSDPKLIDQIKIFKPDIIFSIYYRNMINKEILDIPRYGGINLHPSLLPKYRGTFSCPWAIINNEKKTGITYHFMNEKFDDGKIILQKSVKISKNETSYTLYKKLIELAAKSFKEVYNLVVRRNFQGLEQVGEPSYYKRKVPFNGYIDDNWSLDKIDRFIRAMLWPGKPCALYKHNGKDYHISHIDQFLNIKKLRINK